MLSDRPLVLYKDKDKDGSVGGGSNISAKEAEKAALEWKSKNGDEKGIKVNLNNWMNNG